MMIVVGVGCLIAGVVLGYLWGHRAGSRPWREEQRQREIERRLLGKDTPRVASTAPPAVLRAARIVGTKTWKG